jgi:hypothetical protein
LTQLWTVTTQKFRQISFKFTRPSSLFQPFHRLLWRLAASSGFFRFLALTGRCLDYFALFAGLPAALSYRISISAIVASRLLLSACWLLVEDYRLSLLALLFLFAILWESLPRALIC